MKNLLMNEELVLNGVMNGKFVKNFVMNAKIDPKVVMDLSKFWASSIKLYWKNLLMKNEPWLLNFN